jgi:hypothetical protein
VIVGIIFLVFEINQNNRLLRAQAAADMVEARNLPRTLIIETPEIADFWLRVESGEPLSATDQRRFRATAERAILNWQFQYEQYLEGNLLESQLPIDGWRRELGGERYMEVWMSFKWSLSLAFVEFVEGRVIGQ